MSWVRTVLAELYAMFVDDGRFALAIVVWLAIGGVLLPRLMPPPMAALGFFAGFAAILAEGALRRARGGR